MNKIFFILLKRICDQNKNTFESLRNSNDSTNSCLSHNRAQASVSIST